LYYVYTFMTIPRIDSIKLIIAHGLKIITIRNSSRKKFLLNLYCSNHSFSFYSFIAPTILFLSILFFLFLYCSNHSFSFYSFSFYSFIAPTILFLSIPFLSTPLYCDKNYKKTRNTFYFIFFFILYYNK
jgi:hypothetical protein